MTNLPLLKFPLIKNKVHIDMKMFVLMPGPCQKIKNRNDQNIIN